MIAILKSLYTKYQAEKAVQRLANMPCSLEKHLIESKLINLDNDLSTHNKEKKLLLSRYANSLINEQEFQKLNNELLFNANEIDGYTYKLNIIKQNTELTEFETDKAILELKLHFGKITKDNFDKDVIELEFKNKNISEFERDIALAKFHSNPDEAILYAEYNHKRISEQEYEVRLSTLQTKPYGRLIIDYAGNKTINFAVVHNPLLIAELRKEGHFGMTDDEIIDSWAESAFRSYLGVEIYNTELARK